MHTLSPNHLDVAELFRSIQGESTYSGRPCLFVRLAGCNLSCSYCDTPYARKKIADTPSMSLQEIFKWVDRWNDPLVCITGGEPLLQEATLGLLSKLLKQNKKVLLETNGSLDLSQVPKEVVKIVDVKCPGSGMEAHNRYENLAMLTPHDQVKFVISSQQDFQFAAQIVDGHGLENGPHVLVSAAAPHLSPKQLAQWLLDSGRPWRLQLQLHKILWPDQERGV